MDVYDLPEKFRDNKSPPHKREEARKEVLEEIRKFLITLERGWAIRIHTDKGMFSGKLRRIRLKNMRLDWSFIPNSLPSDFIQKLPTSAKLRQIIQIVVLAKNHEN